MIEPVSIGRFDRIFKRPAAAAVPPLGLSNKALSDRKLIVRSF